MVGSSRRPTPRSIGARSLRRHRTGSNIDHRRWEQHSSPVTLNAIPPCRVGTSRRTVSIYVETVHRLTDLGAVVTHVAKGTSQEGFEAEWREINVLTVEGDLLNRCEIFDEADLDAALARFEELQPPAPRLENAASRVFERFLAHFAARDWDAMARDTGRRLFQRRSPAGGERGDPTWSRCRYRGHAGNRRRRHHERDVDRHRDPRASALPSVSTRVSGRDQRPERVRHRGPRHRRDRRRRADRGASSYSTSTTSTPPSPSSTPDTSPAKRPPTRTRGRHRTGSTPRSTGTNSPRRPRTG